MIRPLGHRIIVQPDPRPDTTASGFLIPDTAQIPVMSGTVQSVGDGPLRDVRVRSTAVRACLCIIDELEDQFPKCNEFAMAVREEMGRYLMQKPEAGSTVEVGDRVAFGPFDGQELVLGEATDDAVVILNEDDVVAVLEMAPATV